MSKQIWLLDLPEACKSGGLDVTTFDGWETRSRSSGGYDDLLGIGYHHDASPTTVSEANVDRYGWVNADAKPIGAMRLHRDGTLVVGCAGATNTMGRGGPLTVSKGTIPKDRGNQTMIAIEAGNNGIGEPWSKVMVDAYVALVGALCKWYGLDPARDIFGHYDYVLPPPTTGRKIDPAGPTPSRPALGGLTGAKTWNLKGFRDAVTAWTPTPEPHPEPPGDDDDMTDEEHKALMRLHDAMFNDNTIQPGYPSVWTMINQTRTAVFPNGVVDATGKALANAGTLAVRIAAKLGVPTK